MRRLIAALVAVLLTSGCALLPAGGRSPLAPTYAMSAYFDRTVAFYEGSRVKIMGIDVGEVTRIKVEGDQVRVDFSVDESVPVPQGVHAGIVPLNLVGERNIVLFPAWKPGDAKAGAGTVIPRTRTELPVEVDDALQAFTELNNAFDPEVLSDGVSRAADALDGNGERFNEVVRESATMTRTLAGQSDRLLKVAGNLDTLAGVVKGREKTLDALLDDFTTVTGLIASERDDVQRLIRALVGLVRRGDVLIKAYRQQLPGDLAAFTDIALSLKTNSKAVADLLEVLPKVAGVLTNAWDGEHHSLTLRVATDAFVRSWMKPIFRALGLKGPVPCLPEPFSNCPWQEKKK
ncbi:MCE family protein [Actinocorallia longicatena]|uniref:MCE family protein n=1 Tax=Actinocorallia longicatena TaxID=111803 RepID=A0ABP6Q713_9ACTN